MVKGFVEDFKFEPRVTKIMIDKSFSEEEVALVANKWYFWKGLFIGAIGMLVSLLAIGLFLNT